MHAWFVFTVQPGKERAARAALWKRGYTVLVPLIKKPYQAKGSTGAWLLREQPVVPGYVFVWLGWSAQELGGVFATRAIRGLIEFGGAPGWIAKEVMDEFLVRVAAVPAWPVDHRASLKAGDMVSVTEGPFVGFCGKLEKVRGIAAAVILDLFGRSTRVNVTTLSIELADTTSNPVGANANKRLQSTANRVNHVARMTAAVGCASRFSPRVAQNL
jgi:transcription antitermination factor NusG